jgi:hypothetical protein
MSHCWHVAEEQEQAEAAALRMDEHSLNIYKAKQNGKTPQSSRKNYAHMVRGGLAWLGVTSRSDKFLRG